MAQVCQALGLLEAVGSFGRSLFYCFISNEMHRGLYSVMEVISKWYTMASIGLRTALGGCRSQHGFTWWGLLDHKSQLIFCFIKKLVSQVGRGPQIPHLQSLWSRFWTESHCKKSGHVLILIFIVTSTWAMSWHKSNVDRKTGRALNQCWDEMTRVVVRSCVSQE